MCLEQHVLMVIHHLGFTQARGKQSTGLDSLLTRVTHLLKLMLLKGTYFSIQINYLTVSTERLGWVF